MKIRYYHLDHFYKELQTWKDRQADFQTVSTTYTKKIVTPDETIFFNEDGEDNKRRLILISSVRNDAKNYLKTKTVRDVQRETDFFNLLDVVRHDEVVVKVDLKSAYWEKALKEGIITKETNEKYKKLYENVIAEIAKEDRVAALGSLATTKVIRNYKNGKFHSDDRITEPTKDLYMYVCDEIDVLMKDVNYNIEGCIYYYWDCIFVLKKHEQAVIDYLRMKEYDVSAEETKLELIKIGNTGYLLSTSDNKIYMTKKENIELLPQIDYDY